MRKSLSHRTFLVFARPPRFKPAHLDARQRTTRPFPRDPARSHASPNARVNVAPPTRDMSDDEQEKQRSSASPAPAVGTARKADATGASADEPPARRQKVTSEDLAFALGGCSQEPVEEEAPRRPDYPPRGGARARVFSRFFKFRDETRRSRGAADTPRVHLTPPSLPFIPHPDS